MQHRLRPHASPPQSPAFLYKYKAIVDFVDFAPKSRRRPPTAALRKIGRDPVTFEELLAVRPPPAGNTKTLYYEPGTGMLSSVSANGGPNGIDTSFAWSGPELLLERSGSSGAMDGAA